MRARDLRPTSSRWTGDAGPERSGSADADQGRRPGGARAGADQFRRQRARFSAIQAGASGYLLKDASPEQLFAGHPRRLQRRIALHPTIALKMLRELDNPALAASGGKRPRSRSPTASWRCCGWWRRAEQSGDRQASDHQRAHRGQTHRQHLAQAPPGPTTHPGRALRAEAGVGGPQYHPPVIPRSRTRQSKNWTRSIRWSRTSRNRIASRGPGGNSTACGATGRPPFSAGQTGPPHLRLSLPSFCDPRSSLHFDR